MFESKQLIEGKIFIHQRRDEPLQYSRYSFPACYFECFINAQNFAGHFIEVHTEPADLAGPFILKIMAKIRLLPC